MRNAQFRDSSFIISLMIFGTLLFFAFQSGIFDTFIETILEQTYLDDNSFLGNDNLSMNCDYEYERVQEIYMEKINELETCYKKLDDAQRTGDSGNDMIWVVFTSGLLGGILVCYFGRKIWRDIEVEINTKDRKRIRR